MKRAWSCNIGNARVGKKVNDLNSLIAAGAWRIGGQEFGGSDGEAVVQEFLDQNPTWRVWRPFAVPGAKAVPIFYDSAHIKPLRLRSVMAVASRYVGRGPGPSQAKSKPILLLAYRVLVADTGRWSKQHGRHLNTHFISGPMTDGGNNSLRDRHHHDHARALAKLIGPAESRRMRRTTVTMDGNADPDYPGWSVVKQTGIYGWDCHTRPTHGERRKYDYCLGPTGPREYISGSSDHRFVGAGI